MLIRPRQTRRSKKFTTRLQSGSRQRREYAATTYSMAVIKAMLAVALITAGIRAYQAINAHTSTISLPLKLALPFLFIAGGLFVARSCVNSIRSVREFSQHRRSGRDK
jgi:hypothetical protein